MDVEMKNTAPVGVFDSGVGGLTVAREIMRQLPNENIVYIGDSATDIPCMRLVKSRGGYSIGVFDPQKGDRSRVYQLYKDGRINLFAPADYEEESDISKYMTQIMDDIAAKEQIKAEQRILDHEV